MAASPVRGVYDTMVDRESAEEILAARHARAHGRLCERGLAPFNLPFNPSYLRRTRGLHRSSTAAD
jgi:hypothetical protein